MAIIFYCNVDENGRIKDSISGTSELPLIPDQEYDYKFELDNWDIPRRAKDFIIDNGKIIPRNTSENNP